MPKEAFATAPPRHVEHLHVTSCLEGARMVFGYTADNRQPATLEVEYPFSLVAEDERLLPLVTAGVALYLGQLGLARSISVDTALPDGLAVLLGNMAAHLYDVRTWRDGTPFVDPPVLSGRPGTVVPLDAELEPCRAQLLWSGGKDSTLSALILKRNGFAVDAVHLVANHGVQDRELAATRAMAPSLGIKASYVQVRHAEYLSYSSAHAKEWNRFPHRNVVPFGRDLLLPLLTLPIALRHGSGVISVGHDRDCRNAWVETGDRLFPRNDVESHVDALVLERVISEYGLRGVEFLPPVAGLSEFAILREMMLEHPELMSRTSFCFWPGESCGRCAKCLRYYLAQRVLGVGSLLSFAANPLADGACPDLEEVLLEDDECGVLFGREILYCLSRLVERGDVRPDESALRRYAASSRHQAVRTQLNAWEVALLQMGDDPQLRGRILSHSRQGQTAAHAGA